MKRLKLPRSAVYLLLFASLWVGLALAGYGIALKKFAADEMESMTRQIRWLNGAVVTDARTGFIGLNGVDFDVAGSPLHFHIPPEFIPDAGTRAEIQRELQPGARVNLEIDADNLNTLSLTIGSNRLVDRGQSQRIYADKAEGDRIHGTIYLVLGLLLFPASVVALVVFRKKTAS